MIQGQLRKAIKANSTIQIVDLINMGAEVNFCDHNGETPLFTAARHGDADTVHTLLALGADLEHQNHDGETALFFAAGYGEYVATKELPDHSDYRLELGSNPEIFDLLMDKGANPLHRDREGKSMLYHTISCGQLKSAARLIELGLDPIEITPAGENLLFAAVDSEDLDCVKFCLQLGLDVNRINKAGESPATLAATESTASMLDYLLQQGADQNHKDQYGNSLIHFHSTWENLELAQRLITAGLDVNAQNSDGQTPLFSACWSESAAGIDLLVEHGVNINHETKKGESVLFYVRDNKVFDRLVELGADINIINHLGMSLLHAASYNLSRVKKLVALGLDVNRPDKRGNTPIFFAARRGGSENPVQFLLDHGADPKHRNNKGKCCYDDL